MLLPGFALLLACIFLLGVGTTFLQVAGNPIMRDVSPVGAYSRNLSFAQGFKGLQRLPRLPRQCWGRAEEMAKEPEAIEQSVTAMKVKT
jgi:hypothetical protein